MDQISKSSEEIMTLRSENERIRNELRSKKKISERLKNDLKNEKKLNERIMKSQVDMDQLNQQNEKNHYKKKGKARLGYKEEGESSKQGAQQNLRPTCNHCGKIGHT